MQQAHTKAAEHHETAAKSHRSAANNMARTDHVKGKELSFQAHQHSVTAREHSETANTKCRTHTLRTRNPHREVEVTAGFSMNAGLGDTPAPPGPVSVFGRANNPSSTVALPRPLSWSLSRET